jgi:hypothetical protein
MIMSERNTDSSTGGGGTSRVADQDQHERDKDEFEAATSYQPNTNQARDEPLPASDHDDGRQEMARRHDEPGDDRPSPHSRDNKRK